MLALLGRFSRRRGPGQDAGEHGAGVRRVDHVVDLERRGGAERLAPGVLLGDQFLVACPAGIGVLERVEFGAVAQPHRALQAHAAELPGRPGHGDGRSAQVARGHRHRAEAVGLAQHHRADRHGEPGAGHEQRAEASHDGRPLRRRPHHEAGRVDQRDDRQPVCLAQPQERRGLVGGVAVDRPAQLQRVAGQQPDRVPADAGQGRPHPDAEPGPQFEHAARVAQRLDDRPHVVAAHPVLRDEVAQHALVAVRSVPRDRTRAADVGQVAPRRRHRGSLVFDEQVHHAVRHLD